MSRTLPILDTAGRLEFERPPRFSYQQRKFFFTLPSWAEQLAKGLYLDHNLLGFILQVGYFRASGRFFERDTFYPSDLDYLKRRWPVGQALLERYAPATMSRHRKLILEGFGVKPFRAEQPLMLEQAIAFAKRQMNPVAVFRSTADYIRTHRVEVPAYATLALLVTQAFKRVDEQLVHLIELHLADSVRGKLDELLEVEGALEGSPHKPYRLTLLKRNLELMKPTAIRANVEHFIQLGILYQMLQPIIAKLQLSDEMMHYYARFVLRSQVFQVSGQVNRKYLMLISFIVYQYFRLGDVLIETLLQAVQTTLNAAQREEKERVFQQHQATARLLEEILDGVIDHAEVIQQMEDTAFSFAKTADEKLAELVSWLASEPVRHFKSLKPKAQQLRGKYRKEQPYYQVLEERSRALQNRISDIIRYLNFDIPTGNNLEEAIANFKKKDGNLGGTLPAGFLGKQEEKALEGASAKVSLYKVLLATHLAKHIKAGKINLPASFQYRSFESYLIPSAIWQQEKEYLLEKALLSPFVDCKFFLQQLKERLTEAFKQTFSGLNTGTNTFAQKRKDGKPRFTTLSVSPGELTDIELFPQDRYIPLFEVLHTVNRHCDFVSCFEHWNPKHRRNPPSENIFFAGLMAYGCNLGVTRMAQTSRHLSVNTLENTVNWYFSLENLRKANDTLVALMGRLKIGELFRKAPNLVHSSSDGQKFYIQVDSIHANYSYKYFGKEKGIVLYSYIDERHRLFFSTTFSASEREAGHVIDGLMHNEVVQSDIHSTDTHGYSEVIFALTHLLGIEFAPRIKEFVEQNLYPMEGMEIDSLNEYVIKIGSPINTGIIEAQWDTILKMVASIKLKHVTASSLLRRLNSYSQKHPVYQALKELGKVLRTLFLLKYMDDSSLRKRIDDQLDKIESAHRFARAVFYANNGEIQFASKEEQQVTDACKRFIQNAIICWNYLYLTQLVVKTESQNRSTILEIIARSSPVSWQHINLQGEFDFSDDALKNAVRFDIEKILELELG